MNTKKYALVALMGMAGATCRYTASFLLPVDTLWATMTVNLTGSFLLPMVFMLLRERKTFSEEWIVAMGTGFIGAFTTFSAFAIDTVGLLEGGELSKAFLYVSGSLFGGFALALSSIQLCERVIRNDRERGYENPLEDDI